jgi:hypothetical protein
VLKTVFGLEDELTGGWRMPQCEPPQLAPFAKYYYDKMYRAYGLHGTEVHTKF